MSHLARITFAPTSLPDLQIAGAKLGLELVPQKNYRWWGESVGDYPLPEGFTKADLGKCDYVLRLPNNNTAYEVGIVKRGSEYVLLWDFFNGGYGLEEAIGTDGCKLKQEYAISVATRDALRQGFRVRRTVDPQTQKPRLIAQRG